MSNDIKQIIILRKDLNMRKGKMCAQASHASLNCILNIIKKFKSLKNIPTDHVFNKWMNGNYKKIVVSVKSKEELIDIYDKAVNTGLNAVLIKDLGLTEFNGLENYTAVAIGPDLSENIDPITKHLELL